MGKWEDDVDKYFEDAKKRRNDLDGYLKNLKSEKHTNIFKEFGVFLRCAESGIWVDEYKVEDCIIKFSGTVCIIEFKDPILASAIVAEILSSPWSCKKDSIISIGEEVFKRDLAFLDNSEIVFEKVFNLAKDLNIITIDYNSKETMYFQQQLVFFLDEPHLDDMENFMIEYRRRA